jgi:hypothetical protein
MRHTCGGSVELQVRCGTPIRRASQVSNDFEL